MREEVLAIDREGQSGILTESGRVDILVNLAADRGRYTVIVRIVAGREAAVLERTGTLVEIIPWVPTTARRLGFALSIPKWGPIQTALERDFVPRLRRYEKSLLKPAPASAPAAIINAGQSLVR